MRYVEQAILELARSLGLSFDLVPSRTLVFRVIHEGRESELKDCKLKCPPLIEGREGHEVVVFTIELPDGQEARVTWHAELKKLGNYEVISIQLSEAVPTSG